MALDRADTLRKDPQWVADRLRALDSRAVAASGDQVLVDGAGDAALLRIAAAATPTPVLLGLQDGAALFAVDLNRLDASAREQAIAAGQPVSLRDAGSMLSQAEGGLAAYLVALLNWHRRHGFCANCGALTEVIEGGHSRRCPVCGALHFPRTDPVVIMLIESEERVLLGRRAGFPARWYSILAGFVSPGESLEEAVIREVREEAGIQARQPRYIASQPWPFPASLMIGFQASSPGGEPHGGDGELQDVGWFDLELVRAAVAESTSELTLPPKVSIARWLIERWVAGKERLPAIHSATRFRPLR